MSAYLNCQVRIGDQWVKGGTLWTVTAVNWIGGGWRIEAKGHPA